VRNEPQSYPVVGTTALTRTDITLRPYRFAAPRQPAMPGVIFFN